MAGSLPGDPSSLEELERLRTDLLSVVAHELRTPITVMRTLTGLLLDPTAGPDRRPADRDAPDHRAQRRADAGPHREILELARFRSGTIRLQTPAVRPAGAGHSGGRDHPSARRRARPAGHRRAPTASPGPGLRRPPAPRSGACSTCSPTPSASAPTTASSGSASCISASAWPGPSATTGRASRRRTRSACSSASSSAARSRGGPREGVGLGLPTGPGHRPGPRRHDRRPQPGRGGQHVPPRRARRRTRRRRR